MDTNKILNFIKSKKVTVLMAVLFGLVILMGTFSMGVAVGYRKAKFSYSWGENYHRNFGGPRGGFLRNFSQDFMGKDFIGAHGTFGQIIEVKDSELAVRGKNGIEQIIKISNDTEIRRFKGVIQLKDLNIDEPIVVIGEPNDSGQIIAKFIRVMPFPSPTRLR